MFREAEREPPQKVSSRNKLLERSMNRALQFSLSSAISEDHVGLETLSLI